MEAEEACGTVVRISVPLDGGRTVGADEVLFFHLKLSAVHIQISSSYHRKILDFRPRALMGRGA